MIKMAKYGTIIFLLLIVAISVYTYAIRISGNPLSGQPDPDFRLAAHDLIDMAERDESQTDRRYMDKIISVSGVINAIQKNDLGVYTISLGSHSSLPASISCALDSRFVTQSVFGRKGDSATIRGVYVGRARDLVLSQCIIEK